MLAISEIACLRIWTRTGLVERDVTTSDLEESTGKTEAQCSVESFSVMEEASMIVRDDKERM